VLGAGFERYASSGEINSVVEDQSAVVASVRERYAARPDITVDDLDGMTVQAPDWWFNLRASNTEPLLRLNVEALDRAMMGTLRDDILAIVRAGTADPKET